MFLPRQQSALRVAVKRLRLREDAFEFFQEENELRIVYKSQGFRFRIVAPQPLGPTPVLLTYFTPTINGDILNPKKETHSIVEVWEDVEASLDNWLDWIKEEYEIPEDATIRFVGDIERRLGKLTDKMIENRTVKQPSLAHLHPAIQQAAGTLYATGHYRQALLDAFIAVDNAVQQKSQLTGSGTRLMEAAFSPGNPVLKIGDSPDEQQGFLSLFRGAMLAIRNPKAHSLGGTHDAQRALEWLNFASVLLRNLDEAVLAQPPTAPPMP